VRCHKFVYELRELRIAKAPLWIHTERFHGAPRFAGALFQEANNCLELFHGIGSHIDGLLALKHPEGGSLAFGSRLIARY
jgi:hypothetical protein